MRSTRRVESLEFLKRRNSRSRIRSNDPGIRQVDKTLFTFAGYNAGPNRIVRRRKEAQEQGLDPSKWFGNVELVAAKDAGQETVRYVGNIFKYYVAYKTTREQMDLRQQGKQQAKGN